MQLNPADIDRLELLALWHIQTRDVSIDKLREAFEMLIVSPRLASAWEEFLISQQVALTVDLVENSLLERAVYMGVDSLTVDEMFALLRDAKAMKVIRESIVLNHSDAWQCAIEKAAIELMKARAQ